MLLSNQFHLALASLLLCTACEGVVMTVLRTKVYNEEIDNSYEGNISSELPLWYDEPDEITREEPMITGLLNVICYFMSEEEHPRYMHGLSKMMQERPTDHYNNLYLGTLRFNITRNPSRPDFIDEVVCKVKDRALPSQYLETLYTGYKTKEAVDAQDTRIGLTLGVLVIWWVLLLDRVQTFRRCVGESWWDTSQPFCTIDVAAVANFDAIDKTNNHRMPIKYY